MTTEKPKTPRKAPAKPRAAKVKDKLAPMIAEAPTAEEAEVRRTRLKTLIALGKERGYLTYAEINDHLPDDLVDAEQIESIISTFNDMGIQVFDVAPAAEDLLMSEVAPTVVDDEQAEAEAEQTLSAEQAKAQKTPIGNLPTLDALDLSGLNFRPEEVRQLLSLDIAGWKNEVEDVAANYAKFGNRLPKALKDQLAQLRERLDHDAQKGAVNSPEPALR